MKSRLTHCPVMLQKVEREAEKLQLRIQCFYYKMMSPLESESIKNSFSVYESGGLMRHRADTYRVHMREKTVCEALPVRCEPGPTVAGIRQIGKA